MAIHQVQIKEVTRQQALQALLARPVRGFDQEELAGAGVPLQLVTEGGRLLLVLEDHRPILWVAAATGSGHTDMTHAGLLFLEQLASQAGFSTVAFRTTRRGLVRKARRLGYSLQGEHLQKVIQ